ncbi:hypothetical protein [Variovorax sp. UC122_21]|uniref:hypothetical protein n=1 Tax=Variovorax sp. UC122_21 TaxID=3374554 RepID=UPI00375816E9
MKPQSQFLDVVTRDEAERRFREHLKLSPLGSETIPLHEALGRVLADDVVAAIDVPGFDRSNVDGFAVRAADTWARWRSRRATWRSPTRRWRPASCRGAK